ncbi:TetR/AcrR family transcriptional regulator [Mycolicibacter terrae]|uniref:TetR family transcriptional regulator n=2 Tax=Mycolicibacter TaxID=1073531 RepID=A0A1A2XUY1_MYCSD|nr:MULTISPECIES: TetR/AcrR family transcriptional regulator [Mycolicibacter]OBH17995.1 TetR family transcriptional regulator [Mycolicibacter sinensis]OBI29559.1 TetR family transcriptional regulator [Mycolicibacter sinensis]RRR46868.1 TetR/AcrR family transcriptional regulator [Mycolicibacter terrae]
MAETTDRRADATRQQIIRAAAHQFAQRPYHDVGLDDILAEAELTKGAMYFHFRSKHALALAVIDEQLARAGAAVQALVDRKLSGLETLIDVGYLMAVEDICRDTARAVLHLLPVVGRAEGLQTTVLNNAVQALSVVAERAIAEGDVVDSDPHDIARVLLTLYLGLRQAGNLDEPEQFLRQIERALIVVLPGMVPADRIDYFLQFIRRRTALAVKTTSAEFAAAGDRID